MRKLRQTMVLLLVALLVTLTACSKKSEPPKEEAVTLEAVRKQAAAAFDGTMSSAQRRAAADEAMRLLLTLLGQSDSAKISDQEWSASPRPGVEEMVRHFDLGSSLHLYALTLPGNTLVESRQRVALQVRSSGGDPQVTELALQPESKLQAAKLLKEGAKQRLTLAVSLNGGGGYVAHLEVGSDGQAKLVDGAFNSLTGTFGEISLSTRDGLLIVTPESKAEWRPTFDAKQPLRLVLAPGLSLDWKQRFVLIDDSRFDAFALFKIAQNPQLCKGPEDCPEELAEQVKKSPKEAAKAAWELATSKMTTLLENEKSWTDEFAGKLPEGSRSLRGQGRDFSARLLSIPAPEGVTPKVYTAVQFRTGTGIPMARRIELPGPVESFQAMSHEGLPALFLLVDQTVPPKGSERGVIKRKGLHLLRLNAGNDWVAAEKWVGAIPGNAPLWFLGTVSPNGVTVEWQLEENSSLKVSIGTGAEPAVSICKFPTDCHKLTWVGGKLHALAVLSAQMVEAAGNLPEDQLLWRANQLAEFLASVDPAEVSAAQVSTLLDPQGKLGVHVLDAGSNVRLVTMPSNPSGMRTAILHAKGQGLVVAAYDGFITSWDGVRFVQGGNAQRLLILGRSDKAAALITFEHDGTKWNEVAPLADPVNRTLQEQVLLLHRPGEPRPVRGLMAIGQKNRLTAQFAAGGVQFCENGVACVTYSYNNGWQLK